MAPTRLYLSGQFEDVAFLRRVRDDLIRSGFVITSRWLNGDSLEPATASASEEGAAARLVSIASQDLEDIDSADMVIVFNPDAARATGRGGRHVETGYALARAKPVILVGVRSNVFHWLPNVDLIDRWEELIDRLRPDPCMMLPGE
jgi:nucleoside 2-deoxyribosyltransferase